MDKIAQTLQAEKNRYWLHIRMLPFFYRVPSPASNKEKIRI